MSETKRDLTADQLEELDALRETNDVVGMSFLHRSHWKDSGYETLVRRGLVKWTDPPKGFRKTVFAGVEITEKGRALLATRRDT